MSEFSEQNRTEQNRTEQNRLPLYKSLFWHCKSFFKKIIFIFADNLVGFIRFSKFSWSNPCLFIKNNLLQEGSIMTQKNILKILVIMIAVLSLFAVSCRKASTSPEPTPTPTPPSKTDPIKNLTGNLLIVSADGTKGANSLPLSFVGASATVSDVKVGQGGDILLFPTNFIIENGNLYLTNLTTTNKDGGEVKAAVSNKVTLTFSLSGENLSRYTDIADIFVGKYSNIYTNTFDTFTNLTTIVGDSLKDANNFRQGEFNFGIVDKTFFKDNTFAITNNKSWRSGQ